MNRCIDLPGNLHWVERTVPRERAAPGPPAGRGLRQVEAEARLPKRKSPVPPVSAGHNCTAERENKKIKWTFTLCFSVTEQNVVPSLKSRF